jgi:hypothetical protein
MKTISTVLTTLFLALAITSCAQERPYNNDDFQITKAEVTHHSDLGVSVWTINVKGTAGKTTPTPKGTMDGAPVLGYVFPTSLKPTDVGFSMTEGIVAMALTSHPDFDDTPIWDENNDADFDNDGIVWHPHWVILHEDKRVGGGLAVKQFTKADNVTLPTTNPGMPMYMDSPGFAVITKGNSIKVVIPDYRMNNQTAFKYDGVAAYMIVNTSLEDKPMLGVYDVFSVMSGDLSLPYTVKNK